MQEKSKIVLVLPRGEAIRNFVLSGTVDILRPTSHVTLISVIPNEEIRKILEDKCDELILLKEKKESYFLEELWSWIDVVHGRWLWSGAAKLRWKIRDKETISLSKQIKRILQKLSALPFTNRKGLNFLSWFEDFYCKFYYSKSSEYAVLLKRLDPDLVFNGSHIHSRNSRKVIHCANNLGIKTATFLFSWDNLTSQGRILPNYDFYMVWNSHIKNDLLKIYENIRPDQIAITGTPQFDFHFQTNNHWTRENYASSIGLDSSRPIILYTTGMLNLMPDEDVIVERLADICNTIPSKPQLVIRVYPKDLSKRFDALKRRRTDIFFPEIKWELNYLTPMPSDLIFYSNMLMHCDIGINVASTVTLELCMFHKPVINIGYNPPGKDISPKDYSIYYEWDHYKPLTDSGAIDIAWDENEVKDLIVNALAMPEGKETDRKKLIEDFFDSYLDGNSYKRIAENLLIWASPSKFKEI